MRPETILRALRKINRNYDALQGPKRRRRARQRARFLDYLYTWAEGGLPWARPTPRKGVAASGAPLTGEPACGGKVDH